MGLIIKIFVVMETVEGLFVMGHPPCREDDMLNQ
jgi:hypothetical protein